MQRANNLRRKTIYSLVIAGSFYLLLCLLLPAIIPGATKIVLTVQANHPETFQLYYWNGLRRIEFQEKYSLRSSEVKGEGKTTVVIKGDNFPVNRVRLDTGETGGVIKLYSMAVESHLATNVEYDCNDISRMFIAGNESTSLRLQDDHVEISAKGNDPFIVSTEPLLQANKLTVYGIPLGMAGILFLLLLCAEPASFSFFTDISSKRPSAGGNVDSLDGLRGLAAVMVVADHTWGRFHGMGEAAVWIFMVLSGFLLARPFVQQPEKILSGAYLSQFFVRRVKRIIPVYYLYITMVYVLTNRYDLAIRHALFLEGAGHLWVIPQEMFFYCLVPFIMILNCYLLRWSRWLVPVNLLILVLFGNTIIFDLFRLYGSYGQDLPPLVSIFLFGILSSYLFHGFYTSSRQEQKFGEKGRVFFSALGIALLMAYILGATGRLWGGEEIYSHQYYQYFGIAAAVLIFSVMAAHDQGLAKMLSFLPLRAIGLVSLSLYIFHPLVLLIVQKGVLHYTGYRLAGLLLFLPTLALTYLVSCLTYAYIERPFIR